MMTTSALEKATILVVDDQISLKILMF